MTVKPRPFDFNLKSINVDSMGTQPDNSLLTLTIDDTFRILHQQAELLASEEALLARWLDNVILSNKTLGECLASMLAQHLECANLFGVNMCELINKMFSGESEIALFAIADLKAFLDRDPACPDFLHVILNLKGFHALVAYRVAHGFWQSGRKQLAYAISSLASSKLGVDIHPAAYIGKGVMLDHGTGIVIGETAVVEDNVSILQGVTLGGTGKEVGDRHPKVRSGALIGAGAKILGNIEVGTMSKVAAGSVVLKDVPPRCTVAGVPARIVKFHEIESYPAFDMQ